MLYRVNDCQKLRITVWLSFVIIIRLKCRVWGLEFPYFLQKTSGLAKHIRLRCFWLSERATENMWRAALNLKKQCFDGIQHASVWTCCYQCVWECERNRPARWVIQLFSINFPLLPTAPADADKLQCRGTAEAQTSFLNTFLSAKHWSVLSVECLFRGFNNI